MNSKHQKDVAGTSFIHYLPALDAWIPDTAKAAAGKETVPHKTLNSFGRETTTIQSS